MGIRPKADGENIILTDTHRALVDDVTATTDEFGTVLGEGINEIAATAKSANDSAGELAARVKVLEDSAVSPSRRVFVGQVSRYNPRFTGAGEWSGRTDALLCPPPGQWLCSVHGPDGAEMTVNFNGAAVRSTTTGTTWALVEADGVKTLSVKIAAGNDAQVIAVAFDPVTHPYA